MTADSYLICDSMIPLHSKAYREAICLFLKSHSITYTFFKGRYEKSTYLSSALEYACALSISKIIFITMEEINGPHLIFDRIKNFRFRKTDVYCFYFKYSNLQGWSLRSLLISICFMLAPIQKIIISRSSMPYGYSRFILRNKLSYAPDFYSDTERPIISQSTAKSYFFQHFNLPSNTVSISFVGVISEKKAISSLLQIVQECLDFLTLHNVKIVVAGPLESGCSIDAQLQFLQNQGVIVYRPEYLSSYDFYCVISSSDAVWCVQRDFSNSSGVFTRTCAWGSIPIVALDSYIGSLVSSLGLGYVLDIHSQILVDQFKSIVVSLLSRESRARRLDACKKYSASCSIDSFHEALKSIFLPMHS